MQRFDFDREGLTGAARPLSDDVAYNARTGRVVASASETGVLAFRSQFVTELIWLDRKGSPQNAAAPPATYMNFSIAPDGGR